jgi:hypothetical protein
MTKLSVPRLTRRSGSGLVTRIHLALLGYHLSGGIATEKWQRPRGMNKRRNVYFTGTGTVDNLVEWADGITPSCTLIDPSEQ